MAAPDFNVTRTSIVERFHAVLYPFPLDAVLAELPQQGWLVPVIDRDEGGGVRLSAPISKGDVKLAFDQAAKTLGVNGSDASETLREFKALRAFMVERFGLSPDVATHFTEFRCVGNSNTGMRESSTPPEVIERWWQGHERSEAFGKYLSGRMFDEPIGVYGVRMATKGRDANRPDWAELTIAPSSTSGTRIYQFDLIYRNALRDKVEAVAASAQQIILGAIAELER